jgi:hypothetical protein
MSTSIGVHRVTSIHADHSENPHTNWISIYLVTENDEEVEITAFTRPAFWPIAKDIVDAINRAVLQNRPRGFALSDETDTDE